MSPRLLVSFVDVTVQTKLLPIISEITIDVLTGIFTCIHIWIRNPSITRPRWLHTDEELRSIAWVIIEHEGISGEPGRRVIHMEIN